MIRATFIPVPPLPQSVSAMGRVYPVEVVRSLDRIRRDLEDRSVDQYAEFCWFAREYPRIYRHHVDHAAFRLLAIHRRYTEAFEKLKHDVEKANKASIEIFETSYDDLHSRAIYWDFEAFLTAVNCSLDALARVIGTAYKEQTPPSFNKLCSKMHLTGLADILRDAKSKWVQRLKDYRDCFTHYTPVDTVLTVCMRLYPDGWQLRCRVPTNPNSREILRFRFARRTEILRYSLSVWRSLSALDRRVACEINSKYAAGEYPKRIENLFFIGTRDSGGRKTKAGNVNSVNAE